MAFAGILGLTQTRNSCLLYESKKYPNYFYEFSPRDRRREYFVSVPYRCLGCQKSPKYVKYFGKCSRQIMVSGNCFLSDPDEYIHSCSPYPRLLEIGRQIYRKVCKEFEGKEFVEKELMKMVDDRIQEEYPDEANEILEVMSSKKRSLQKFCAKFAAEKVKTELENGPPKLSFESSVENSAEINDNKNGFETSVASSNFILSDNNQFQLPPFNAFHYNNNYGFESSAASSANLNSNSSSKFQLPPFNTFHYSLPSKPTISRMPSMIYPPGPSPHLPSQRLSFQTSYIPSTNNLLPQNIYNQSNQNSFQQQNSFQFQSQNRPQNLIQQQNYHNFVQRQNQQFYFQQQMQQQHFRQTLSYFNASMRPFK